MIRLVIIMMMIALLVAIPVVQLRAEPDCEHVGVEDNPSGNARGNGHECIGGSGDNPEPVRSCNHKNSEKDNNDNGEIACIPRGQNTDD